MTTVRRCGRFWVDLGRATAELTSGLLMHANAVVVRNACKKNERDKAYNPLAGHLFSTSRTHYSLNGKKEDNLLGASARSLSQLERDHENKSIAYRDKDRTCTS